MNCMPAIVVSAVVEDGSISEVDLIEHVSLASSERDHKLGKGTSSSLHRECHRAKNMADADAVASPNQKQSGKVEHRDNGNTTSTESVDETSLIVKAKLADDGLHYHQGSHVLSKQSEQVNQDSQRCFLEIDVSFDNKVAECRTPTNSVVDDATSLASGTDDKRVVSTELKAESSGVTDDMSNDRDFGKLMTMVLKEIQDCDADEIIKLFVGSGIVEEGHLTGYVSPEQVIAQLRKYRFLSRDNLHHLQAMVMRLDDSELYFRCVQYLKHNHDIVFFYPELEHIPKGFDVVRCFIGGRDFTRFTREDVELVRYKVASMVFMPSQFFYVIGVEPGHRVVLSFMALERYIHELHVMAKDGLPELNLIGVDAVQFKYKIYSTTGRAAADIHWANRMPSYTNIYRQLREKNERIEEQERIIRNLREEVEFLRLEVDTVEAEVDVIARGRGDPFLRNMRSRSRSSDARSRGRSMPSRENTRGRARDRLLELTTGLERDKNECPIPKPIRDRERRSRYQLFENQAGNKRERGNAVTYLRISPGSSPDRATRQRIVDRNHIMNDIQSIIDEISNASNL